MIPLLKDTSAIPKRAMLRAGIDRAVIRSDGIDPRELNEGEGRGSGGGRAKRESRDRGIGCDCVVSRGAVALH
jgi:hypothetical protein